MSCELLDGSRLDKTIAIACMEAIFFLSARELNDKLGGHAKAKHVKLQNRKGNVSSFSRPLSSYHFIYLFIYLFVCMFIYLARLIRKRLLL